MSKEKDRQQFHELIVWREWEIHKSVGDWQERGRLADLLMRHATTYGRIAEAFSCRELTETDRRSEKWAENGIRRACEKLGITPIFSGDPRGYTVKVLLPSKRYNTWGGEESGWGVPGS